MSLSQLEFSFCFNYCQQQLESRVALEFRYEIEDEQ